MSSELTFDLREIQQTYNAIGGASKCNMEMTLESNIRLNYPRNVSFTEFILQRTEQFGDRVAMVDDETGRAVTYSELRRDIIRCAAALYRFGMRCKDRICLLTTNCVECPIVMLAIMQLGAICVPINYMSTKYELREIDCEPTFFITTPERIDDIDYATATLPDGLIKIVTVGSEEPVRCNSRLSIMTYQSLMQSVPDQLPSKDLPGLQQVADNQHLTAIIGYSSGTTGKPKGCMHSHFSLIATSLNIGAAVYGSQIHSLADGDGIITSPVDEVTITALSMAHMFGINMYLAHTLSLGFKLIVMKKFEVKTYLYLTEKYQVTVLHVVPPLLTRMLRETDHHHLRRAMSSVRNIISAAVCLNDDTARLVERLLPNVKLGQQYGMTELMTVVAWPADLPYLYGCSGRPLPGVSIKVVDQRTRPLGPNENGAVLVKSTTTMTGYWKNLSSTQKAFHEDRWYITGDYGHYDEAGNLFVIDRIKDILRYKGYQVSPTELETVLLRHPDVIDAAVIAVKDAEAGDLPRALIVGRQGIDVEDIVKFVNERVAAYKRLRGGVFIVDHIPRTASGKIIRRLLVDRSISSSNEFPLRASSKL